MQNKFISTDLLNPTINKCAYYPFQKQQQISTTTKQNLLGLFYLLGKSNRYMSSSFFYLCICPHKHILRYILFCKILNPSISVCCASAHSVRMQTSHKLLLTQVLSSSTVAGTLPETTHGAWLTIF